MAYTVACVRVAVMSCVKVVVMPCVKVAVMPCVRVAVMPIPGERFTYSCLSFLAVRNQGPTSECCPAAMAGRFSLFSPLFTVNFHVSFVFHTCFFSCFTHVFFHVFFHVHFSCLARATTVQGHDSRSRHSARPVTVDWTASLALSLPPQHILAFYSSRI